MPLTRSCTANRREEQPEDPGEEAEERRADGARHPLGEEQDDADACDGREDRQHHREVPPACGWARQSAIAVAIAPGPATSGVASGTSATSPESPVGKSVPRSISSATSRSSRPPAIERLSIDTSR